MTRYIVHKDALEYIDVSSLYDSFKLSEAFKVTDEGFHFYHLPYISVVLSDEQANEFKSKGIELYKETVQNGGLLATDYQKQISFWVKPVERLYTGVGCNVAVLDTGSTQIGTRGVDAVWVEYDYGHNFSDDSSDVTDLIGHGTNVCSIIKSSLGLAPDCTLSILKVYDNSDNITDTALLAAIDWCIDNNQDVINMSFQYDTAPVNSAISTLISSGIVAIASSGNSSTVDYTVYPAALNGVIAVNMYPEDGVPVASNILPPPGGHGVTLSASGRFCECIYNFGTVGVCTGTSFAAPFVTGMFALYHEQYAIMDNAAIMTYITSRCIKTTLSNYYGAGIATF